MYLPSFSILISRLKPMSDCRIWTVSPVTATPWMLPVACCALAPKETRDAAARARAKRLLDMDSICGLGEEVELSYSQPDPSRAEGHRNQLHAECRSPGQRQARERIARRHGIGPETTLGEHDRVVVDQHHGAA